MTEIVFAAIVTSADELDDDTDPATWKALGVTAKNMGLHGEINTISGFYLPEGDQFVFRTADSVLACFHTPQAALAALARAQRSYGEYRGRIAAAERELQVLRNTRSAYVRSAINTEGLSLADAVDKI